MKPNGPGVCYWLHGRSHALVLTVSLWSLRKHYLGPAAIMTTDTSANGLALKIGLDGRLNAPACYLPLCQQSRNSALVTKTWLHRHTPFDPTVYLDADTLVAGRIQDLFPTPEEQVVWTHFAGWHVLNTPYESRIRGFVEHVNTKQVHRLWRQAARDNHAAVNNGVWGFWKTAECLEPIHELAVAGARRFIPDESSVQLLYAHFPHKLVDDRFNHSPRHGRFWTTPEKIVVHHAHGGKHLRVTLRHTWLAHFREVWEGNVGQIQSWISPEERAEYVDGWLMHGAGSAHGDKG